MYQKLILIGRLGRDPESRFTPDGTPVTTFSVATDRRWTDASGQQQSKTTWFRCVAWRRLAETCNQYLSKGQLVMVEGEVQEPKVYQSKDGEWRASLDLVAYTVKFLSSKTERQADSREIGGDGDEESIPF
jgi:single-strand DNA-binding protein